MRRKRKRYVGKYGKSESRPKGFKTFRFDPVAKKNNTNFKKEICCMSTKQGLYEKICKWRRHKHKKIFMRSGEGTSTQYGFVVKASKRKNKDKDGYYVTLEKLSSSKKGTKKRKVDICLSDTTVQFLLISREHQTKVLNQAYSQQNFNAIWAAMVCKPDVSVAKLSPNQSFTTVPTSSDRKTNTEPEKQGERGGERDADDANLVNNSANMPEADKGMVVCLTDEKEEIVSNDKKDDYQSTGRTPKEIKGGNGDANNVFEYYEDDSLKMVSYDEEVDTDDDGRQYEEDKEGVDSNCSDSDSEDKSNENATLWEFKGYDKDDYILWSALVPTINEVIERERSPLRQASPLWLLMWIVDLTFSEIWPSPINIKRKQKERIALHKVTEFHHYLSNSEYRLLCIGSHMFIRKKRKHNMDVKIKIFHDLWNCINMDLSVLEKNIPLFYKKQMRLLK